MSPIYHGASFSMKMLNTCLMTRKNMNVTQNCIIIICIPSRTSIHENKIHSKTSIIQEDIWHIRAGGSFIYKTQEKHFQQKYTIPKDSS